MSWRLDPTKTGLLIIDMQERLMAAMHQREETVDRAARAAAAARLLELPLYVTEQTPDKLGPTVEPLRHALGAAYFPIAKRAFSACGSLPKGHPRTLLVVGVETHVCVRQTVLDLRDTAVTPFVLADACASRRLGDHNTALEELRHGGVPVTTFEAAIWELLGTSEHPKFREALAIIK